MTTSFSFFAASMSLAVCPDWPQTHGIPTTHQTRKERMLLTTRSRFTHAADAETTHMIPPGKERPNEPRILSRRKLFVKDYSGRESGSFEIRTYPQHKDGFLAPVRSDNSTICRAKKREGAGIDSCGRKPIEKRKTVVGFF